MSRRTVRALTWRRRSPTRCRRMRSSVPTPAAGEKPAVKFSGSFDGPGRVHLLRSRRTGHAAVGRLSLTAQGELSESVKWKLSGRVDGDLVYATSDFYLDPVKQNQRLSAIWGENYLDVSAGSWDFRVGAQQIIWGEVIGLFFADVVSARDMREFLLPSFDVIRIPQWAARAEYFAGDSHAGVRVDSRAGVRPDRQAGRRLLPGAVAFADAGSVAALFQDPERPDAVSTIRISVCAPTRWSPAGISRRSITAASARSRRSIGWPRATSRQPFVFQPRHDRIWQAGGTVSKDLGELVLRGEAVYASGQGSPALEIPYCHHEKWDGNGYPQGLKGKNIPMSARIFAVVMFGMRLHLIALTGSHGLSTRHSSIFQEDRVGILIPR